MSEDEDNKKNASLAFVFCATGFFAAGVGYMLLLYSLGTQINIKLPNDIEEDLATGKSDACDVYEEFAERADHIIRNSGKKFTIEIKSEGEAPLCRIEHIPVPHSPVF